MNGSRESGATLAELQDTRDDVDYRLLTPGFLLVAATAFFYFIGVGMLLPTLPLYIKNELGGNGLTVGIVVGVYAAVAGLLRITAGKIGDRRGRRILVLGGAAIVAVCTAAYSLAASVVWLFIVRMVAGIGDAGIFVGAATLAQDRAPAARRGEAASYFSIALYGGLALGPFIGESIYDSLGSDATWLIAGGLIACASLLSIFITDVVTPGAKPVSDNKPSLLHPAAILPGAIQLLALMPFTAFTTFLALHLETIGIEIAGPMFLLYGLTVLFVRLGFAKLPDRLGPLRTTLFAITAIIVASLGIAAAQSAVVLYAMAFVFGLGMSMLFPGLFTVVMNDVTDADRSHAVGTFSVFFDASQALGPAALGLAVFLSGSERIAFAVATIFSVIAIVLTLTKLRPRVARGPVTTSA